MNCESAIDIITAGVIAFGLAIFAVCLARVIRNSACFPPRDRGRR